MYVRAYSDSVNKNQKSRWKALFSCSVQKIIKRKKVEDTYIEKLKSLPPGVALIEVINLVETNSS